MSCTKRLRWVAWVRTGFGKKLRWWWLPPLFDEVWQAEEYVREYRCGDESATRVVLPENTMPWRRIQPIDFDAELRKKP